MSLYLSNPTAEDGISLSSRPLIEINFMSFQSDTTMDRDLNEQTRRLVFRAKEGDTEAFESLYRLYAMRLEDAVRKTVGERLKARVESDDLIQSVWKDLLPDIRRFEYRGPDSFFRWFSVKLKRKIQDKAKYFARKKRATDKEVNRSCGALPSKDPTPSEAAMRRESVELLMSLLDQLPDPQRQTLVYRLRDDMEFEEIAAAMEKSADAVRKLYARALERIQSLVQKDPGKLKRNGG